MFEPRFTFTSNIVNQLTTIERLYTQLTSIKLIPSLALRLAQQNMILATHHSTSIEGNPLDQQAVTNILLDDKVPVNKSEREVKNYFAALNHISVLARAKQALNLTILLEMHRIAMRGLGVAGTGQLRTSSVIVGNRGVMGLTIKHNPPAHSAPAIRKLLQELLSWTGAEREESPFIVAGITHHRLAEVHPFFDGNGRVARLATSYYLLTHGYEVSKHFILDDYYDMDRLMYSDKLHSADAESDSADFGDATEWLQYFLEGIVYSLQAALARAEKLKSKTLDSYGEKRVLVTPREEEVIQIILEKKAIKSQDVVETFGVTRQQAHALLSSLVRKGVVKKYGQTKSSYYRLVLPSTTVPL